MIDLKYPELLAEKMEILADYHNFVLKQYYQQSGIPVQQVIDELLTMAPKILPMVADVNQLLYELQQSGQNLIFEGAQGTLLDVDLGTYPYVTSSNTTAGAASTGTGFGPLYFDEVIGIAKAYMTRVGGGPFPTELLDDVGKSIAKRGNEFGAVTGRP